MRSVGNTYCILTKIAHTHTLKSCLYHGSFHLVTLNIFIKKTFLGLLIFYFINFISLQILE